MHHAIGGCLTGIPGVLAAEQGTAVLRMHCQFASVSCRVAGITLSRFRSAVGMSNTQFMIVHDRVFLLKSSRWSNNLARTACGSWLSLLAEFCISFYALLQNLLFGLVNVPCCSKCCKARAVQCDRRGMQVRSVSVHSSVRLCLVARLQCSTAA